MKTVELTIPLDAHLQEFLIADLADLDFDTFVQEDAHLKAYIPAARWTDVAREQIERWLVAQGRTPALQEQLIEPQNWNRQWEETIQPLAVGPFLVKPTWADVPPAHADRILLEIDPKMSFGTGYHETTRLMLRFLPQLVRGGERVLDAGTGTGVLAIGALRLGAASALAFDVDEWAVDNAVENFLLNGVADQAEFRTGGMDVIEETGFDLILANINLNVLLGMMPAFADKLSTEGRLALAGLLRTDRDRIVNAATRHGFRVALEEAENEWLALVFYKAGAGL